MTIESTHDRYYRLVNELAAIKQRLNDRAMQIREQFAGLWHEDDSECRFFEDESYFRLWDEMREVEKQLEIAKRDLQSILSTQPQWIKPQCQMARSTTESALAPEQQSSMVARPK